MIEADDENVDHVQSLISPPKRLEAEVRRCLETGDITEAMSILEGAVVAYPRSRTFLLKLARLALELHAVDVSRLALNKAIKLGADQVSLGEIEPRLLMLEGKKEAAIEAAIDATNLPTANEVLFKSCIQLVEGLAPERSNIIWRKYSAKFRLTLEEQLRVAQAEEAAGNFEEALYHVDQILCCREGSSDAILVKVRLLIKLSDRQDYDVLRQVEEYIRFGRDYAFDLVQLFLTMERWLFVLKVLVAYQDDRSISAVILARVNEIDEAIIRATRQRSYLETCVLVAIHDVILPSGSSKSRLSLSELWNVAMATLRARIARSDDSRFAIEALILSGAVSHYVTDELGQIATAYGDTAQAVSAWILLWRKSRNDEFLIKAASACLAKESPCSALVTISRELKFPSNEPLENACIIHIARAAAAEIGDCGVKSSVEILEACKIIRADARMPVQLRKTAGEYLSRLREKMRDADRAGDLALSIACAKSLLVVDPKAPYPLKVLARRSVEVGDYLRAAECYRILSLIEPNVVKHAINYGKRYRPGVSEGDIFDVLLFSIQVNSSNSELFDMIDWWLTAPLKAVYNP